MTTTLSRRDLLKTIAWGTVIASGTGAITMIVPQWAQAADLKRSGPRITFVRTPISRVVFTSGAHAMDLYHAHPHNPDAEKLQPQDIRLQARLAMRNHKEVLDRAGLTWRDVVKVRRYQKDMSESPAIEAVMAEYFRDWWPAMTVLQIERLSSPQARLELEMVYAGRR